jgi:hypothetical protein
MQMLPPLSLQIRPQRLKAEVDLRDLMAIRFSSEKIGLSGMLRFGLY